MSSPKKQNRPRGKSKTKAQLEEELVDARKMIKNQEHEILSHRKGKTQLELRIRELEETLEDRVTAEPIPSERSSYLLDIKPHEGRASFMPTLTKEKEPLPEQQAKAVIEAIAPQLPKMREQPIEEVAPAIQSVPVTEEPDEPIFGGAISTGSFLHPGQEFEAVINLGLDSVPPSQEEDVEYKVTIFAKPLHTRTRQILGKTRGVFTSSGERTVCMIVEAPPAGTYRLEAVLTFETQSGIPTPCGSVIESSLVEVR